MINWDSLTIEKILVNQQISKSNIVVIIVVLILFLIVYFYISKNDNGEQSDKGFIGNGLIAIVFTAIILLIPYYKHLNDNSQIEFYKINFKVNDPKVTSEMLLKTKDVCKPKRYASKSEAYSTFELYDKFKPNSSDFYFKDGELYASIYMYASEYKNIKKVSEFKNIVSEYTKSELNAIKQYKTAEDIEKERREMSEYLQERLVNKNIKES